MALTIGVLVRFVKLKMLSGVLEKKKGPGSPLFQGNSQTLSSHTPQRPGDVLLADPAYPQTTKIGGARQKNDYRPAGEVHMVAQKEPSTGEE